MAEFQTGPSREQEFTAQVYEFTSPERYHVEQDPQHRPIERPFAPASEVVPTEAVNVEEPPFVTEVQRRPEINPDVLAVNQITLVGPNIVAARLAATGELPEDDLPQYYSSVPGFDLREAA